MTNEQRIAIATAEVQQAKIMVEHSKKQLTEWEERYDLRTETLDRLTASKEKK